MEIVAVARAIPQATPAPPPYEEAGDGRALIDGMAQSTATEPLAVQCRRESRSKEWSEQTELTGLLATPRPFGHVLDLAGERADRADQWPFHDQRVIVDPGGFSGSAYASFGSYYSSYGMQVIY